jgi:MFS family permease
MITVSTVLVMAGQGVIAPVLPLYARSLGVTIAAVGLALGIFGLARLILNVPIGVLSDRYGRRFVLLAGPLVVAVGMVGSGLARTLPLLLVARFVAGAGSAMYMTGAQLYLIDISTPANRTRFIATNQGALLTGVAIGPGIGGLLAEAYGLRMPFYVVGGGAVVAGLYALWRIPETNQPHQRTSRGADHARWRDTLRFATSVDFLTVCFVGLAIFSVRLGARGTLMPLLGYTKFDLSPAQVGGVLTVTAVVGLAFIAPAAFLADRFGRKAVITPAGIVSAGGIVLMAVAPSAAWLVVGACLSTFGTTFAGAAPAAYVGDISPAHLRGLSMGLYRSAGDLGFVLAPPLLGLLADHTSIGWAMISNAALMAFAFLLFGALAHESAPRKTVVTVDADVATTETMPG